jgi:hypothetical protein
VYPLAADIARGQRQEAELGDQGLGHNPP